MTPFLQASSHPWSLICSTYFNLTHWLSYQSLCIPLSITYLLIAQWIPTKHHLPALSLRIKSSSTLLYYYCLISTHCSFRLLSYAWLINLMLSITTLYSLQLNQECKYIWSKLWDSSACILFKLYAWSPHSRLQWLQREYFGLLFTLAPVMLDASWVTRPSLSPEDFWKMWIIP